MKSACEDRAGLVWFRRALFRWYRKHGRSFPWRKNGDPYAILVSEVLLQQTWAGKVAPVYHKVLKKYPTIKALAKAKVALLRTTLHPLGFSYRAGTLVKLAGTILQEHGGRVPDDQDVLLSLPGVGQYTCAAVRCFAFGQRSSIVDTNVVRVVSRYFGIHDIQAKQSTTFSRSVFTVATAALPKAHVREYNYALLDLGAVVCRHYAPLCDSCPLAARCIALNQGWRIPRNSRDTGGP